MQFETTTLESMCELIVDCPHSTPKWTDNGFVVLRNQNIRNGILDLSEPSFTDENGYLSRIKRATPKAGDIVFTREAPMGEVCIIPEGVQCCLGQRQVLLRPKKDISGVYLFWALQSPFVKHQISWNEGTGTTVSNVRIPVLKSLLIPRIFNQEIKIAEILNSLANKISVNKTTNQTLEAIAQTLFKSWFVDFDPVKAKLSVLAAGGSAEEAERAAMFAISARDEASLNTLQTEQPEAYAELARTAALFPSAMQDSELGEIPEGWNISRLQDCCIRVEAGGTPKRSEASYWGGNIKWLSSGEVRNPIVLDTKERITELGLQKSTAKLWPKYSTIVAMYGATAGQVCLISQEMAANQACCALIPKQNYSAYIFLSARRSIEDLASKASGSAQQNLNKSLVSEHRVIKPEENILKNFEKNISTLISKWEKNIEENKALEYTRDTLLPKLLSGELTVTDNTPPKANPAESDMLNAGSVPAEVMV